MKSRNLSLSRIVIVATAGFVVAFLTHTLAAPLTAIVFEAENGTLANAISSSSSLASNNSFISFQTQTPGGDGIWRQITPDQVSTDFNNPPDNYGIQSIAMDPNNSSILYFGARSQGIWKSTNAGASWGKINTGTGGSALDTGMIWEISIDPFNSNIVWATSGYGTGGPHRSTDGGVSWVKLPVGSPTQHDDVASIVLDPYLQNHMLITSHSPWSTDGVNSGVSESFNGGQTWIHHQPPAGTNWGPVKAANFLTNSQSWLIGSESGGMWRTTNSGTTWTQITSVPISHGGSSLIRVNNAYFMVVEKGVMTSTDNGVTWTDISSGLGSNYLAGVATDGTYLYTAPAFPVQSNIYIDGPWYRRAISGGSWTAMTNSPNTCRDRNGVHSCNGPFSSVYDEVNHIAYTNNGNGGIWKLSP